MADRTIAGNAADARELSQAAIAEPLAWHAHRYQKRRNGSPYIHHPERVASRMTTDDEKAVAWLHDVLEDTMTTAVDLMNAKLSTSVINAVIALTKVHGESYMAYLSEVKANPLARRVKIADILDNLSDDPTPRQIRKYAKALLYLTEGRDDGE